MKHFCMAIALMGFIACAPVAPTVISWREPNSTFTATPTNRSLLIAMVKDEVSRRIIEDKLARKLRKRTSVSYNLLPEQVLKNGDDNALVQVLKDGAFSHILMVRLAPVNEGRTSEPGTNSTFFNGFQNHYGNSLSQYNNPRYLVVNNNFTLETSVYSVNPYKLIWIGNSPVVDPKTLDQEIEELAEKVIDQMKKDGFLK
jgi:hypothetical protein